MVLFNKLPYIANQVLVSEHLWAQALTETGMDMQTMWVAVRALGVAAGLLVHASAPQHLPAGSAALAVAAAAVMADAATPDHWRHMPHGMSMEQVYALLGR